MKINWSLREPLLGEHNGCW